MLNHNIAVEPSRIIAPILNLETYWSNGVLEIETETLGEKKERGLGILDIGHPKIRHGFKL